MRTLLRLPIGEFVWGHLLVRVDVILSNEMLLPDRLAKSIELIQARELLINLCGIMNVKMPFFLQSLNFVITYEKIIADRIPFEERTPNLPVDFLMALVVAYKKKCLIPLTTSDRRILTVADYLKVNLVNVESIRLAPDRNVEVPLD